MAAFRIALIMSCALSSSIGSANGSAIGEPVALVTLPADALAASAANPPVHSIYVSTGSAAVSLQRPSSGVADYRLELKASQRDPEQMANQHTARSDLITVNAEVSYGKLAKLRAEGNLSEFGAPTEDEGFALDKDFTFMNGASRDWEANRVNDVQLKAALLDDRLRITSRRASSSYGPLALSSRRSMADLEPDRDVFAIHRTAEGEAFLHRLDADIRRSEDLNISVFGLYSKIDADYEYIDASSGDPFGKSDRESRKFGTTVRWNPIEVTLAREHARKLNGPEEALYEATISVDLDTLWSRFGSGDGEGLWALAPSSTWANVAQGEVGSGTGDRTSNVSLGLSWDRPDFYASVDVWDYRYDSGAGTYDWAGSGGYAGFGANGERWSVDAGIGMYRAENKETISRSSDFGFDKNFSFSHRAENLPDLSVGFFSGHYRTDYLAYGGGGNTALSHFNLTLDFTKYLPAPAVEADGQRLKFMYRYEGLAVDDSFAGKAGEGGHSVGFFYRMRF
jgi:hypothetical protein